MVDSGRNVLAFNFGTGRNGGATSSCSPVAGKTRLVLTHSGIQSPTGGLDFGSGWNSHLTALEERPPGIKNFSALHAQSREAVKDALAL